MAIPGLLSETEQHAVWLLMLKGASPALACQQTGVSIEAFWLTRLRHSSFDVAIRRIYDTLDHNVVASVYRQAMEGNVAAQRLWLARRPAMLWSASAASGGESDAHADQSSVELARQLLETECDLAAASECLPDPSAV
jgi:hypothetical protein